MFDIALKVSYLAAIGLSLYTSGWLFVKADKNRTTGALAACQVLIILWCIPQLFSALPMTKDLKYLSYGISYVGISFIGPAWLRFAYLYSKRKWRAWTELLLFAVAAVNYSMLLTNEYHHLFYRVFEVERMDYGPVFYLHMLFPYLCVLAGMGVVLRDFRKNRVAPAHIVIILLAAAVPLGFNLLYMTGWVKSGFDLTPPAFALSSLLMLLAVFRYDFLDINTLAFEQLFSNIAEGVAVCNGRGVVTYCNDAASRWFGVHTGDNCGALDAAVGESDSEVHTLQNGEKIEVKRYVHRDKKGKTVAETFLFTDVGKYFELLEQGRELAVSNQKLAILQERNRIAQEVHDTAGHTLTMIHSLMKLIQVEFEAEQNKNEKIPVYLKQARELASGGIRELRCSINQLKESASYELVTQGVCQLAESVKEFEVEVDIQGEDGPEYSHLSSVVYGCLREAVTNCLKYAGATHMDVILKFAADTLQLYIFDNGAGCERVEAGNGLNGIRERVEQAGGRVRFLSESGGGFQMVVKLPVKNGKTV